MKLDPSVAFELLWAELGGPDLEKEFRFHPTRRWRADYAHPESRLLIEIEGGTWTRGRHVRPAGYAKDAEKYNAAALDGWCVVRLTTDMVNVQHLLPIIAFTLTP